MDSKGGAAIMLAVAHGFEVALMSEVGVRVRGSKLEVGPLASPDMIVTIACRRHLERQGILGELALANKVESLGYLYEPEPWRSASC